MVASARALAMLLLGALLFVRCAAHGKLARPAPRDGKAPRAGLDENNPVPLASDEAFVCRYGQPNPAVSATPVQAGGKLTLEWYMTAAHVGDCAVYISYDVGLPRRAQRYVKIANLPDCKSQNMQPVQIDVPAVLPAGRAILRWDWPALHIFPTIEWFVTCADIEVQSSSAASPSSLDSFLIADPPIYPTDGNTGVGFRNPWGGEDQYMTGPACIEASLNSCALTAPGARGYTGFGGGGGADDSSSGGGTDPLMPSPTPTAGPRPAPSTPEPAMPASSTAAPMPTPSMSSAGWRPWDGAATGFSAGLCATPGCGGSYTKAYNVQACTNVGYRLDGGEIVEPSQLPWPFGQGPQPALNECSNPGELRTDLCPNILKFADLWQPEVDGRTFSGSGDSKLIQGFGHAFTKVADGLPCGFCAVARAKRVLTDGGYNYMIIMRVDVTDDISPEVDEVTGEFGSGVVQYPEASRIPYEYKIVSCETGQDIGSFDTTTSSLGPTLAPTTLAPTSAPSPATTPAPSQAPPTTPVPARPSPTPAPTPTPSLAPTPAPEQTPAPSQTEPTVPAPPGSQCVPETDCSVNPWCAGELTVFCSSQAAATNACPAPQCRMAIVTDDPSDDGPSGGSPSGGGPSEEDTCVPESDCGINAWCNSDWTSHCATAWLDGAGACSGPLCKMGRQPLAGLLSAPSKLVAAGAAKRVQGDRMVVDQARQQPRLRAASGRRLPVGQTVLIQRQAAISSLQANHVEEEVEDEQPKKGLAWEGGKKRELGLAQQGGEL